MLNDALSVFVVDEVVVVIVDVVIVDRVVVDRVVVDMIVVDMVVVDVLIVVVRIRRGRVVHGRARRGRVCRARGRGRRRRGRGCRHRVALFVFTKNVSLVALIVFVTNEIVRFQKSEMISLFVVGNCGGVAAAVSRPIRLFGSKKVKCFTLCCRQLWRRCCYL